jgi:hypothetical protein
MTQPTSKGQSRTALSQLSTERLNVVADVSLIVHGLRLLQSEHLRKLSLAFLTSVVHKRIRRLPEPQDLANYLCGSMEGAFANEPTDI